MRGIFYGNYFYGICAAALSAEITVQAVGASPPATWLLATGTATVWFYTRAFLQGAMPADDARTIWLQSNRQVIRLQQTALPIGLLVLGLCLVAENFERLSANVGLLELLLAAAFPIIAFLYDARQLPFRLRKWGFFKPFVIALVWTGCTGVLPLLWLQWVSGKSIFTAHITVLLLHRWMFLAVIAAAFDIKDYADDSQAALHTWVVRSGLRQLLFGQLLPLAWGGCIGLLLFSQYLNWQSSYTAWMLLPMVLLLTVLYTLRRRRSLMYYLTVVDGLVLVQAICGMMAACV